MTREEHLAWCKKRALENVDAGLLALAVISMRGDLNKHPETLGLAAVTLPPVDVVRHGPVAQIVRQWIEGFK